MKLYRSILLWSSAQILKVSSLFLLSIVLLEGGAHAVCASLVKGYVAYNVEKCIHLSPEKTFQPRTGRLAFIEGLSPEGKKEFYSEYRGLVVEGLVVRSLATRSGLAPEKGALNGDNVRAFIPPGESNCKDIMGKRIKVMIDEACCEGGGNAPCLLNTSYQLKDIQVLGTKTGGGGNIRRLKVMSHKKFKKANKLLRKKKFAEAVVLYEELREQDVLDARGYYFLGYSYRMEDECGKAISVLNPIYKKSLSRDYWVNEEKIIRKGTLLYARCLSRVGRTGEATLVLNSLLTNPKRFHKEIEASLNHGDFGRLKTTKDYQKYVVNAREVMAKFKKQP